VRLGELKVLEPHLGDPAECRPALRTSEAPVGPGMYDQAVEAWSLDRSLEGENSVWVDFEEGEVVTITDTQRMHRGVETLLTFQPDAVTGRRSSRRQSLRGHVLDPRGHSELEPDTAGERRGERRLSGLA